MGLIELILAIALVGFIVWIVLQIPMPAPFRNLIVGIVVFAVIIWLLQGFHLIHGDFLRLR